LTPISVENGIFVAAAKKTRRDDLCGGLRWRLSIAAD